MVLPWCYHVRPLAMQKEQLSRPRPLTDDRFDRRSWETFLHMGEMTGFAPHLPHLSRCESLLGLATQILITRVAWHSAFAGIHRHSHAQADLTHRMVWKKGLGGKKWKPAPRSHAFLRLELCELCGLESWGCFVASGWDLLTKFDSLQVWDIFHT